jgi:hypothetical protein
LIRIHLCLLGHLSPKDWRRRKRYLSLAMGIRLKSLVLCLLLDETMNHYAEFLLSYLVLDC